MNFSESDKFRKEFKKLLKKYRTLEDDFEVAKKVIAAAPKGDGGKHWNILRRKENRYILKTRMMCRVLKGAELRLIYYYDGNNVEVVFIEIYYKGDKGRENQKRIEEMCDIYIT